MNMARSEHDAIDETRVGCLPTGAAFLQRCGNPCAVNHRADVPPCAAAGGVGRRRAKLAASTTVQQVQQKGGGVTPQAIRRGWAVKQCLSEIEANAETSWDVGLRCWVLGKAYSGLCVRWRWSSHG